MQLYSLSQPPRFFVVLNRRQQPWKIIEHVKMYVCLCCLLLEWRICSAFRLDHRVFPCHWVGKRRRSEGQYVRQLHISYKRKGKFNVIAYMPLLSTRSWCWTSKRARWKTDCVTLCAMWIGRAKPPTSYLISIRQHRSWYHHSS